MKRRSFLKGALVAVASLPVVGGVAYWLKQRTPDDYVWQVVQTHLPYLKVTREQVNQFTQDYLQYYGERRGLNPALVQVMVSFEDWFKVFPALRGQLERMEQQLARDFLLATDFFQQGAEVQRPVQYVGVYSPYLRACTLPFRRLNS